MFQPSGLSESGAAKGSSTPPLASSNAASGSPPPPRGITTSTGEANELHPVPLHDNSADDQCNDDELGDDEEQLMQQALALSLETAAAGDGTAMDSEEGDTSTGHN